MAKKRFQKQEVDGDGIPTTTESWNIAQYYTGFAIALPLRELNELEMIARFGTVNIDENIMVTDDIIDKRRADAVKRYWVKIKQIVSDTIFKVRKGDIEKAKKTYEEILKFPKYFDGLLKIKSDALDHEDKIEVNEKFLITFIDKLVEIKKDYLVLLNRSGLIFKESDEFDVNQFLEEFAHGG